MAHDIPRRLTLKNVSYGISRTMGRFYYNKIPNQNRICTELRADEMPQADKTSLTCLPVCPPLQGTEKIVGIPDCGRPSRLLEESGDREDCWDPRLWSSLSAVGGVRGQRRLLGSRIVVVPFGRWKGLGTEKIVGPPDCSCPFRLVKGAGDREVCWDPRLWSSLRDAPILDKLFNLPLIYQTKWS